MVLGTWLPFGGRRRSGAGADEPRRADSSRPTILPAPADPRGAEEDDVRRPGQPARRWRAHTPTARLRRAPGRPAWRPLGVGPLRRLGFGRAPQPPDAFPGVRRRPTRAHRPGLQPQRPTGRPRPSAVHAWRPPTHGDRHGGVGLRRQARQLLPPGIQPVGLAGPCGLRRRPVLQRGHGRRDPVQVSQHHRALGPKGHRRASGPARHRRRIRRRGCRVRPGHAPGRHRGRSRAGAPGRRRRVAGRRRDAAAHRVPGLVRPAGPGCQGQDGRARASWPRSVSNTARTWPDTCGTHTCRPWSPTTLRSRSGLPT